MGYTVERGQDERQHCETREDVERVLKAMNWGKVPMRVHTSPGSIERYSDELGNVISVIPDLPENPA